MAAFVLAKDGWTLDDRPQPPLDPCPQSLDGSYLKHVWIGNRSQIAIVAQAYCGQIFRHVRPSRFNNSHAPGGPLLPAG